MPIFGANPSQDNLPIRQVKDMKAQGLDNNQIIQTLQRDGYASTDIFEAMNQVDMVSGAPQNQSQDQGYSQSNDSYGDQNNYGGYQQDANQNQGYDQGYQDNYSDQYGGGQDMPPPSGGMMPPPSDNYQGYSQQEMSSTEELVEAIIDEKWNDLMKDVNKIVEWKNSMTGKISAMEQKFDSLKSEFDKLHQALISKIDDYDKNITNVGAEVKAMEKVFSKVLPVFTENVSELSRITKNVKDSKATKKKSSKK